MRSGPELPRDHAARTGNFASSQPGEVPSCFRRIAREAPVTDQNLIDRLSAHKTVGGAPRQELEWLAAHGTLRQLAEGEVLSLKGVPVTGLFLILSGQIAIYLDRGAGRHKVMEWRDGDVTGLLPYS